MFSGEAMTSASSPRSCMAARCLTIISLDIELFLNRLHPALLFARGRRCSTGGTLCIICAVCLFLVLSPVMELICSSHPVTALSVAGEPARERENLPDGKPIVYPSG